MSTIRQPGCYSSPQMPRHYVCRSKGCRTLLTRPGRCDQHPDGHADRPIAKLYASTAWKRTRETVFDRDDRTCRYCGIAGALPGYRGRLIAAHLDETTKLLELGLDALDVDRIVTAHSSCAERNAPARARAAA